MVKEKIFINGVALDLGNDSINLSYENNFFGAVDTLKLSFSYSFTLPRTLINDGVFMQGYDPATGCDALRKYYPCEYEREGVIILRGSLCVNSINARGYSCVIVWGLDKLKTMSDEKQKLWQLPQGTRHQNDTIRLTHTPTYDTTADFLRGSYFGFARYFGGLTPDKCAQLQKPAVLPVVNVRYILGLITERYRVTLGLPSDRDQIVNKMVVALTGGKIWREGMPVPRGAFVLQKTFSQQYGYQVELLVNSTANGVIYQKQVTQAELYFTVSQNVTLNNLRIEVTNTEQFSVESPVFGRFVAEYNAARNLWVIDVKLNGVAFNVGDDFALTFAPFRPDDTQHTWLQNLQLLHYDFDVKAEGAGVQDNQYYFIPANLPDITAIDFIKELCAFLGVVPVRVTSGAAGDVIECNTLDDVLADGVQTLDALGIDETTPHFSDWAQRNYYKFAVNEYQMNDYAAAMESNDKTAAFTRDAFVSSFSALVGANEIPLYTLNAEGNEATYNEVNNVLCLLNTNETTATLTQTGLTWRAILGNYHATKRDILRNPVVVSIVARLTPEQTQQLDTAKCFYIPLLSNYYLPIKAETNGDTYKFDMIRLARGTQPTPPDPDVIVITEYLQYFAPSYIDTANNQNRWQDSGGGHMGIIIPISDAESVIIKAEQYHGIKYAMLTDIANITELGARPSYATGYTAPVVAPAGEETTASRPANAQFLYFERTYDAGIIVPEYIKIVIGVVEDGGGDSAPDTPEDIGNILTDTIRATQYRRYINSNYTSVATTDAQYYSIFVPVTSGKTYRLYWDTTDAAQVGTIFRFGATNTLPTAQSGGSNISLGRPRLYKSPQNTQETTVTIDYNYLVIEVSGDNGAQYLSHLHIYEL